jgi:predicted alpha/beta-hydrolase family hydrolase
MASRRSSEVRTVGTPIGDARVHVDPAVDPVATLVLGHGAGGGVEAPDLVALARSLPASGITVVRVEQPWRVAGKRVAAPPATLDRGWLAVLAELAPATPLVVGGRSAGARVACRTATALGATGVIALAFPLHPPGRPDRTRLPELDLPSSAGLPVLVLQGTRDAFGGPADIPPAAGRTVVAVDGADHSFRVLKGGDQPGRLKALVAAASDWVLAGWGESSPRP